MIPESGPVIGRAEIAAGARDLGIAGSPLCNHVSLRSFGGLEEGPATVVERLLDTGSTVIVATMANQAFSIPAPLDDRPARNGLEYAERDRIVAEHPWPGMSAIYHHTSTEVDTWLGASSAYVAARPDRIRCRRPVGSFSAVGPLADEMIRAETEEDVYGPLRALVAGSGWVVLMGVDLTSMTLIHLAEVGAGRRPFIRWAGGAERSPATRARRRVLQGI